MMYCLRFQSHVFFKRKSPCVQIILMEVVKNLDLKGMEVI